jgi:hypothetical protein
MKKRLKKKLEKRAGRMHYSDARMELLIRAIRRVHPDTGMVIITTSKSGRCIEKITACIGPVYPSGMSMSNPSDQYIDIHMGGCLYE